MRVPQATKFLPLGCALVLAGVACAGSTRTSSEPVVDDSATTRALHKLPRPPGDKVPVTIHEFTSETPEINARQATDMFTTALVKSGQFKVVERHRIMQGVAKERQLAAAGDTNGTFAPGSLRAARYVFEAVLTEVNPTAKTSRHDVGLAGAQVSTASAEDVIGIDVRIVDVASGDVVDSVNVRTALKGSSHGVTGVGAMASSLFGSKLTGTERKLVPEVSAEGSRKDSVNQALRACIEAAVHELSKRFQP